MSIKINSLITFGFILFSKTIFSQITSGEIIYDVDMDNFYDRMRSNNEKKPNASIEIFKGAAREIKNMKAVLNFSNNKSVFQKQEGLSLENQDIYHKIASSFVTKGTTYTDLLRKSQIILTDYGGNNQKTLSQIKEIDWTLTKDSKKIKDFICYRAESTKKAPNGIEYTIVAWYAPDIPVPLGPNEYVGSLPGLILELHDITVNYQCTSISLNTDIVMIKNWPSNSGLVSDEENKKSNKKKYDFIRN